eukprot:TRINITY_DN391_c0_g1_i1.p2 TRINITY_DN391_c0_g1~~TRINITY_DN391_c0_g1_i1.p2  ORF type:complete len:215 (+),score=91.75 TRINITY_DN391_c0_g1_i1:76-645(+)
MMDDFFMPEQMGVSAVASFGELSGAEVEASKPMQSAMMDDFFMPEQMGVSAVASFGEPSGAEVEASKPMQSAMMDDFFMPEQAVEELQQPAQGMSVQSAMMGDFFEAEGNVEVADLLMREGQGEKAEVQRSTLGAMMDDFFMPEQEEVSSISFRGSCSIPADALVEDLMWSAVLEDSAVHTIRLSAASL